RRGRILARRHHRRLYGLDGRRLGSAAPRDCLGARLARQPCRRSTLAASAVDGGLENREALERVGKLEQRLLVSEREGKELGEAVRDPGGVAALLDVAIGVAR